MEDKTIDELYEVRRKQRALLRKQELQEPDTVSLERNRKIRDKKIELRRDKLIGEILDNDMRLENDNR